MFTTKSLHFRAYQPSDQESLLALYNDLRVAPFITHGFVVPVNADRFDHVMKLVKESLMFCILEELETKAFVGFTLIFPVTEHKNRNATWGIALLPNHWHKGYGGEVGYFMVDYAFRHLASHRVTLTVVDGNDRAVALYKRIGFVEEGRMRKLLWMDGGWRDLIHMGILEDEWTTLRQTQGEGGIAS
ncbi:acyl-CoA N-acyltransferase [Lyophyllum atratum]|nr:acyl-CoA N-acyltransferase [Lyophyllum atratum]